MAGKTIVLLIADCDKIPHTLYNQKTPRYFLSGPVENKLCLADLNTGFCYEKNTERQVPVAADRPILN